MLTLFVYGIFAIVIMIAVELVKKFTPKFWENFKAFNPIVLFVIAFLLVTIYNVIIGKFVLVNVATIAYVIASTQTFVYDGVVKLIKFIKSKIVKK